MIRKYGLICLLWFVAGSAGKLQAQGTPLELFINSGTGCTGDKVCLDVTAKNFKDVESIQFNLSYNANLVVPQCPAAFVHPDIENNIFGDIFNCTQKEKGFLNFVWAGNATTIPDGELLFTLCFTITGPPGNVSPVFFNGLQLPIEICKEGDCSGALNATAGNISVACTDLQVLVGKCDADSGNISKGGSVTFYFAGGTAPYSWVMAPGGYNGTIAKEGERFTLKNVPKGIYSITVTDAVGSTKVSQSIVISDNVPLQIDSVTIKSPTCYDRTNGVISVEKTSGGIPPYNFQWSTLISGRDSIDKLATGNYFVTITDADGCQIADTFTLSVDTLRFVATPDKLASCEGVRDGLIGLTITGGTPFSIKDFEFSIEGPDNVPTWRSLSALSTRTFRSGTYIISVRDSFGCLGLGPSLTLKDTLFLDFDKVVSVDVIEHKQISCAGKTDGFIKVTGNPAGVYSFVLTPVWPNSFTSSGTFTAQELPEGNYKIVIRDGAGCTGDTTLIIREPDTLKLNASIIQPDCASAGTFSLSPTGGTGAYSYLWSPDQGNVPSVFNISGGSYSVTVTDENNCSQSLSQSFGTQGALTLFPKVDSIRCAGVADGKLCVDILSGNGPFTIIWRNAAGNQIDDRQCVPNIGPGVYTVVVTDKSGCSNSASITVTEPADISTKLITSPAPCFGEKGSVSISIDGNPAGYTFEWKRKGETGILDRDNQLNDIAGDYIVTAISPKGCRKEVNATITQPAELQLAGPVQTRKESCFGNKTGGAALPGAITTFNLFWSSNPGVAFDFAANLAPGSYWVYGQHKQTKCKTDTLFFTIDGFPPLQLEDARTVLENPSCFGFKDGRIDVAATGGTGSGYTYRWNTGAAGSSLTPVGAGTYIVTLSDMNNCETKDTLVLTEPTKLEAFVDKSRSIELDCNNQNGGKIALTTMGGNVGIKTFTWQSGVSVDNGIAISLSPGTYCATVSDNRGCLDTVCYSLSAPAPLKGSINDPVSPLCFGDKTCISVKSITGGTGNKYTFQINNGKRFRPDTCITVTAGQYYISFIDSTGCSTDTIITIDQPDPVFVELGPDQDIQLGLPSPVLDPILASGISIVSSIWTPIDNIRCLNPECSQVEATPSETTKYTLLVTDSNGCTGTDEITIRVKNTRNVYFPNVFTPNRDGNNDFFQVVTGPGVESVLYLLIYDRWGNLVYERRDFMPDPAGTDGWDGTFRSTRLDPGAFVYLAKARFLDGKEIDYSGSVVLADKVRN